ncbi:MAG: sodium/solute symporter [Spirochaetota bacterium]|nr:sodium/solute symporter [Spirochaetota bacterium]
MNIDIVIILIYILIINIIGIMYSGSRDVGDYFLGNRSMPWIVVCFSIVATETSTLTFLSIPGLAYVKGMGFIQVAFGYLAGRVLVAAILIPKYYDGGFETVYEFLQSRFSVSSRRVVAIIFHITRLLADSVRLFATAIPLAAITGWDYWMSILVLGGATFIYTLYGGLRSVIMVDSVQLFLYLLCALIGIHIISNHLSMPILSIFKIIPDSSLKIVYSGLENGFAGLFSSYNIFSGIIGGAFLSFASHGTDHLIVQRVLSCRDEASAKKAMIFSGIIIIMQFFMFLLFGLFIKALLNNMTFDRSDEIMTYFIVNYLPDGLRGVMLAGIFAAAMSTLSSSINSLSSSTTVDILGIDKKDMSDSRKVGVSRIISLVWAMTIIGISILLQDSKNPLVEVGLSIASVTYGGMMGIFIMGRFFKDFHDGSAIAGVALSIAINLIIAISTNVFWLWYVVIGFGVSFVAAVVLNKIVIMGRDQN